MQKKCTAINLHVLFSTPFRSFVTLLIFRVKGSAVLILYQMHAQLFVSNNDLDNFLSTIKTSRFRR